jgi:hypothetical protein
MKRKAILYLVTPDFLPQFAVSFDSYLAHNQVNVDVIKAGKATKEQCLLDRPKEILELFDDGYDQVLHLGADMMFYGSIDNLWKKYQRFDTAATPHLLTSSTGPERYAWTRLTGIYNSDFTMWMNTPATREFLLWQKAMMEEACLSAPNDGYFYDQGYLDMLPVLTKFAPIKDPRINIAYYNLFERASRYTPLAFQYTGYDPDYPAELSRYIREDDKKHLTNTIISRTLKYFDKLVEAGWTSKRK